MVLVAAGGWTALRSWAQGGRVSIKLELVNNSYIMLKLVGGVNDDLKKKVESTARMDGQVVVITGANTGIGFDQMHINRNKLSPLNPFPFPFLISLPFIDNTVLYSSCWYETAWEPHLRESEVAATQYQVGTAFFLVGLSYMLASLPAGAVSEKQSTSTGRI